MAVCSDFNLLFWPARATYQGHHLRHRVSLYSGSLDQRIAVFDRARFPINDVAFHPVKSLALIATGAYDGGYCFEGDLWLWNWESDECYSLLDESREAVRCRFTNERRAAVLLRPRFDEEYPDRESHEIYLGVNFDPFLPESPNLESLEPVEPREMGFAQGDLSSSRFQEAVGSLPDYERRARVWDLCWLSDDQIAAVHDFCQVEVWKVTGGRQLLRQGEGFGVQLLIQPTRTLVNVIQRSKNWSEPDRSTLLSLDSRGVNEVETFEHAVLLSVDRAGNVLCRDTHRETPRQDKILSGDLAELWTGKLGHYDCFNHYLRLDGGDGLFFLRGTPPDSHKRKRLCVLSPDGSRRALMDWDGRDNHLMNSSACWASGGTLVRAFIVYDPRPGEGRAFIQRCRPETGEVLWSRAVGTLVAAMVVVETMLVYALTDGSLGLIQLEDGELVWEEKVRVGELQSMVISMAARGSQVAAGTVCGNLLLFAIE